jgi:hypothetical protein
MRVFGRQERQAVVTDVERGCVRAGCHCVGTDRRTLVRRTTAGGLMEPLTPTGLPVLRSAVHPDLSPASDDRDEAIVARGPLKVYSPGLADWEPGIDLRTDDTGLTLTTPAGHHAYATGRFTVEVSPDGRIIWILGREELTTDAAGASDWPGAAGRAGSPPGSDAGSADAFPPVTVLMPTDLSDLCSRMPGVEFADLGEAAHVIRRLTISDGGLVFRRDGRWVADDAADRIPLLTRVVPVALGAVARFDRLERSPSMSLSLFDRFTLLPDRFRTAASRNSADPRQLSAV